MNQLKDIIEGLLGDSQQSMKGLYELFYKPLCFYAVRYVSSMPVAEEVVSDVMFNIWQKRNKSYSAETFRDYLYAATRNTAINYLKQRQNQRKASNAWSEQLRNQLIDETPLDMMISEEMQAKINNLLSELPEQCRKVFLMSRIDDMSYEEIAAQMDISMNTVKYHIKTALQKIRAGMGNILMCLILFLSFFVIFFSHAPTLFLFSIVLAVLFQIS